MMKPVSRGISLTLGLVSSLTAGASGQIVTSAGQVPQFLSPVTYFVPGAYMAALADVNGDGILDIVTANGYATNDLNPGGQGVSVLLGNGDGTFQDARTARADGNPSFVVVGDFNNDGKADIAVLNGPGTTSVSLLYGNGDGTFQAPVDTLISDKPMIPLAFGGDTTMVAADFNGDGKLDLALGFDVDIVSGPTTFNPAVHYIEVLLNNGDGTFTIEFAVGHDKVIAADFDGDGNQDLYLYGGSENPPEIRMGNGDGRVRDAQVPPGFFFGLLPLTSEFALVGDFNGDGMMDIASRNFTTWSPLFGKRSTLSLGLPGGTFSYPNPPATPAHKHTTALINALRTAEL